MWGFSPPSLLTPQKRNKHCPIFIWEEKTQGSVTYGHDSKRCFTARDAPCTSWLCNTSLPPSACLSGWLASRRLVNRCIRPPIHLPYRDSFCLLPCPPCYCMHLSVAEEVRRSLLAFAINIHPNHGSDASVHWPMWLIPMIHPSGVLNNDHISPFYSFQCSIVVVFNFLLCVSVLALHFFFSFHLFVHYLRRASGSPSGLCNSHAYDACR